MGMMMAVSFERYGRLYYLDPGDASPRVGDKVLVPTDDGPEVAECVWAPQWVGDDVEGLPVCAGLAGPEDLERDERNRRFRASGRAAAKRLIRTARLPMRIVAVDYLPAEPLFTVYFTAERRVDFRGLLRDLGRELGVRVEFRQVGARDEARMQGGVGSCGRELCCATFLKDFEPVAVRMAKDQGLPVNPMRIAGACGKLMCCLKYEHPLYRTPGTEQARGRRGGGSCDRASVCGPRRAHEEARGAGGASPGGCGDGGDGVETRPA
ncbi:PSP1 domain-containing protein [Nocardiopsis composta]|uniref:Cell fate regulator YaaT (PSP1 superfamily) n=1 Tax=Nocardiopsis composta TaxID=157465 RepID=A0A7W8VFF5_9ACTN|nr:regulatory iron-sulfur-containing complex subunit RicT [Nocardiopsis composta]MBB5434065.1 cell fate regulator YaaT (PSP1 superfamily) [Nocardiopsis composta]